MIGVDAGLGSILLAFIAILVSALLIWRSDKKHAAVGRRYAFPARDGVDHAIAY